MSFGNRLASLFLCLSVLAFVAHAQQATPATPAPARGATQKANARPPDAPAPAREPFDGASVEQMAAQCVTLETDRGAIALEMLPEAAPESVRNFLNLSATGMYDTTTFSRVVKDFVIQGGNLSTREKITMDIARRSRRTIPDEPNYVKHTRGTLSMARADEPNTATTNFFILVSDAPHLDGKFAAFGRVKSGMSIVDDINAAPRHSHNLEKPVIPVRVKRATVAACEPKSGTQKNAATPKN